MTSEDSLHNVPNMGIGIFFLRQARRAQKPCLHKNPPFIKAYKEHRPEEGYIISSKKSDLWGVMSRKG